MRLGNSVRCTFVFTFFCKRFKAVFIFFLFFFFFNVQTKYEKFINRTIQPLEIRGMITPGQSEPGSNGNKIMLHFYEIF